MTVEVRAVTAAEAKHLRELDILRSQAVQLAVSVPPNPHPLAKAYAKFMRSVDKHFQETMCAVAVAHEIDPSGESGEQWHLDLAEMTFTRMK